MRLLARFRPAGALGQGLLYAAAIAVAKGVAFAMVPVFTHHLAPSDYGRLDVLQTLADLLSVVVGLGLADLLYRRAGGADGEQNRRRAAARIFTLALLSGAVFLVAGQVAAPLLAHLLPGGVAVLEVRLILVSLSFSAVILVALAWLRMRQAAWLYFIASAGRAVLQAGLALAALALGYGVAGVLGAGMAACLALVVLLALLQTRSTGLSRVQNFGLADLRPDAAYCGPLLLAGMAAFVLGSFDRWVLAAVSGTESVAVYAVAAKYALIVAVAMQPFELWWLARRFELLKAAGGERIVVSRASSGVLLAGLCTLGMAALGPIAIRLMTPADYHMATDLLAPLALAAGLHACGILLNLGLYAGRTTWRAFRLEGAMAAIALIAYFTLIPLFGSWGAAWATLGVQALRLVCIVVLAQRERRLPYPLRAYLQFAAAVAALTVLTGAASSDPMRIAIGLAGAGGLAGTGLALGWLPADGLRARFSRWSVFPRRSVSGRSWRWRYPTPARPW